MLKKYLKLSIYTLCSLLLFSSCLVKEGCTDENASNFDVDAEEDDGSCTFPTRKFSFYTTSPIGGKIHVELSSSHSDQNAYSSFYYTGTTPPSTGAEFNFDPFDENYPVCGLPNLGVFERVTSDTYYYDAFDELGNVWSGTVSAEPGVCKLVEINRDSSQYKKMVFYYDQSIPGVSGSVKVIINPHSNADVNRRRTTILEVSNLFSSSSPSCNSVNGDNSVLVKNGLVKLEIQRGFKSEMVSFVTDDKDCEYYNLNKLLQ